MTFDIKSIDLHIVEDIFCFRSLIGITVQESADKVHGEGSWPTARDVDVARQDFALDDVVVIILNVEGAIPVVQAVQQDSKTPNINLKLALYPNQIVLTFRLWSFLKCISGGAKQGVPNLPPFMSWPESDSIVIIEEAHRPLLTPNFGISVLHDKNIFRLQVSIRHFNSRNMYIYR